MIYILLIIFSVLLSNENSNSFSESKKTFSKNKFSQKENIYDKYDSLYVKYTFLLNEIELIKQLIYDFKDSTNSNFSEIQDTTNQIKKRANIFKKNTRSSIKGLESEMLDNTTLMIQQDSVNASHIDDIKTRFEASRAAQKLANERVKKDNKELLERVNALEAEINELKGKIKK